jgi:HD-GYP domain-containing protein (c-di-GMP phosphodiesterase class II)
MVRFSNIKGIKSKSVSREDLVQHKREQDRVWLSDARIQKVGPPDEAVLSTQDDPEVKRYCERFIRAAMDVRDKVSGGQGISPSPLLADLHYIVEHDLIERLYGRALSGPDDHEDLSIHSVEVTFSSLMVGKGIGYNVKQLLELGLAAFLENVGMYTIPGAILQKQSKLEESEIERIKQHPEMSYQILCRLGEKYRWLAEVALQVHERADGSGYPRGLKGGEISELASIIGLIDTYVALIRKRPYRDKFLQPDAIKFILKESKSQFSARVLKVFLNYLSFFPLHTCVKLNNKSIGRVVSTDKNQPLRPTVELLYDGLGRKLEKRELIRLSDNPLLYVVEALDQKDFT